MAGSHMGSWDKLGSSWMMLCTAGHWRSCKNTAPWLFFRSLLSFKTFFGNHMSGLLSLGQGVTVADTNMTGHVSVQVAMNLTVGLPEALKLPYRCPACMEDELHST